MEAERTKWENTGSKDPSPVTAYSLPSKSPGICHLARHELKPPDLEHAGQEQLLVTVGTFDCYFAVLSPSHHENGIRNRNFTPAMKEEVQVKTHYPILHCVLEYRSSELSSKLQVMMFLMDIYSNLYSLNLTKHLELQKMGPLRPLEFTRRFCNGPALPDPLYLHTPLYLSKHQEIMASVTLGGQVRIFDLNQENSYFSSNVKLEPEEVNLGYKALAACHGTLKHEGSANSCSVICLQTQTAPFIFVNCFSRQEYERALQVQLA